MKTPLIYQMTAYDCGPTSVINAFRQLFDRKELPPDLLKMIWNACLDEYEEGKAFRGGTSMHAFRFLHEQITAYAPLLDFPAETAFLCREEVHLKEGSPLVQWVQEGGAAVVRIRLSGGHYVLVTGIDDEKVYLFDPYMENLFPVKGVEFHMENSRDYNVIVDRERFDSYEEKAFMMAETELRTAFLLRRKETEK
ncbi:MAG: C39 family peptidase [Solobacterium sp.]|jgi:predicted double-glycine peptidase|nr:C39 family peptidase [Solobacterium sp.]